MNILHPEYFNTISEKCFLNATTNNNQNNKNQNNIITNNKQNRENKILDPENPYVPKMNEYNIILQNNYNANQLKYLMKR